MPERFSLEREYHPLLISTFPPTYLRSLFHHFGFFLDTASFNVPEHCPPNLFAFFNGSPVNSLTLSQPAFSCRQPSERTTSNSVFLFFRFSRSNGNNPHSAMRSHQLFFYQRLYEVHTVSSKTVIDFTSSKIA